MKTSIIVPAYNEAEGIGKVLSELKKVAKQLGAEIVVVDDGSEDNTSVIASKSGVKVVKHPYNMGYGASLKTGIKNSSGDVIVITDADGTYPSSAIPELVNLIGEYGMVVGARIDRKNISPLRLPGKWFLRKLANYLTSKKIPDLNSGLRAFKRDVVMSFFNILPPKFSFTTTITLACLTNEIPVKFVPIEYGKRIGKSKMKIFGHGLQFPILIVRTIFYFNPLKILLPVSLMCALIGIAYIIFELYTKFGIATHGILFILTGIIIACFALVADLISRTSVKS